jgi:tetratricopeptide repeat protein
MDRVSLRAAWVLLVCSLGLTACSRGIDVNSLEASRGTGDRELASGHYSAARAVYEKLLREIPGHPGIQLPYARSLVGLGLLREAAAVYREMLDEGFGVSLKDDPGFAKLVARPEYASLGARVEAQSKPQAAARVAFEIPEERFIAEGLAFDPRSGWFFASSTYLRKIVVRESDGHFRDFVGSGDHGLLQVLGMKVDSARSRLVVVTATDDARMVGFKPSYLGRSGVFIYQLPGGRLLQATWLASGGRHLFNDLVLGAAGEVYITDSDEGRIYRLSADGRQLTAVTAARVFLDPNGIDIEPQRHRLFVADVRGVSTVDLDTGAVKPLAQAKGISSVDLDGLYLHGDYLIGVQSLPKLERVVAFRLSVDHRRIVAAEPLDSVDPRLVVPTEGVVVGDELYFVARSFQDFVDAKGVIAEPQQTAPTPVLAVRLPVH